MPVVEFISPDGSSRTVEAAANESVMRAAVGDLVPGIIGECGGDASCATCHVFVAPEWFDRLPEAGDDELAMLEATSEEPTEFSRLSCQIIVGPDTDGLVVNVPATQQ